MNDVERRLARLQKKLDGDGPAERQVLLLKLVHEFENAPEFGNKYIADAASPAQLWVSRIGALLARAGVEHKIRFQTINQTSVQFWGVVRESFRRALTTAIEEIKLELELDGRDEIGQVYDEGKEYDFYTDLREIVSGASREIFIVDAYFDAAAFQAYLSTSDNSLVIRILCSKYASDLNACVTAFQAQTGADVEIRKTRDIHDRVLFIDGADCWIVGASIKDAGKKPTYLVPLAPQLGSGKLVIYEKVWSQATTPA